MTTFIDIIGVVTAVMAITGLLLYLGWCLAGSQLDHQRAELRTERALLDAQWRALEDTRRVREIFLDARREMRREADRHAHGEGAS